jgi:hypothetical protein
MLRALNILQVLRRLVARVQILGLGEEFLLDESRAREAENGVRGACFVVCA